MPYANANGIRLYYESAGDPDATPLILQAHGHRRLLVFQVPYFAQFYHVIVFDRRGTGRSDDPPGPWTIADFAQDLRGLMDTLKIDRAIVGGSSLGGVISSQFGLDFPDRARGLIVGHTTPYRRPLSHQWMVEQIELARKGGPVIQRQPRSFDWEEQGPPTAAPGFADTVVGRFLATLEPGLGSADATIKMLTAMLDWDQRPRYPEMAKFPHPVLVIVGGNEPQGTIETSHEWSQQWQHGEFQILPNTHHAAGLENPLGWNAAVHGWLKRRGLS